MKYLTCENYNILFISSTIRKINVQYYLYKFNIHNMNYWLFKSEPSDYSYDDLVEDKKTQWEGIRNYQARNFIRDRIKINDKIFFIIQILLSLI